MRRRPWVTAPLCSALGCRAHDPRIVRSVWAPLGQTTLSRSGLGTNKSDGPWRSSRGHRCSLGRAGLLSLLILLVLLLAGQSGLLRAGRNPHSVGLSDSVSCHPNQGHDRRATARDVIIVACADGRAAVVCRDLRDGDAAAGAGPRGPARVMTQRSTRPRIGIVAGATSESDRPTTPYSIGRRGASACLRPRGRC